MSVRFITPLREPRGTITSLLQRSYAELLRSDPEPWSQEAAKWQEYDREVFRNPATVGACAFVTWSDDQMVGFGSYDPRQKPELGIVGHNCILPEFRGQGLGAQQIREILRRFQTLGIRTAKVTTHEHPFFVPAQRMYVACGFHEVRRIPWDRAPGSVLLEYESVIG